MSVPDARPFTDDKPRDARRDIIGTILARVRSDAYAQYRGEVPGKKYATREQSINTDVVEHHLTGAAPIAVYPIQPGTNQTKVAVLDLDDHEGNGKAEVMMDAAKRLTAECGRRGFNPLPVRSGGGRGVHLWMWWDEPQNAADVRASLADALAAEGFAEGAGGGIAKGKVEIFPKEFTNGDGEFPGGAVALPFARKSVPLDGEMRPADEPPGAWPSSQPAPLAVKDEAATTGFNIETVRSALATLKSDDYGKWINFGVALKLAFPDRGFDLWAEWSKKSNNFGSDAECQAKWKTFKPDGRITTKTIIWEAKAKGWKPPSTAKPKRTITLTHWADMTDAERRPYLVKGLLSADALSVLFGAPGSMKSFVAIDIAAHVAMGRPWAGLRVNQAPVVYIACEGGRSIGDRLAAFAKHHGLQRADVPFYVLPETVNLREAEPDLEALIAAVLASGNIGLIIVDTLSRALAGGNENAPDDMGNFVMNVDRLRVATGAHVMIIHHSGKDETRGARGHSLLKAAVDTEIMADRIEDVCVVTVAKQRDMAQDLDRRFEPAVVELYDDDDGDPVTSLVLKPTDRLPDPDEKLTGQTKDALDELWKGIRAEGVHVDDPDSGVPSHLSAIKEERWRERCATRPLTRGGPTGARKAFLRAKKALIESKKIGSAGEWVWPWPKERQGELPITGSAGEEIPM